MSLRKSDLKAGEMDGLTRPPTPTRAKSKKERKDGGNYVFYLFLRAVSSFAGGGQEEGRAFLFLSWLVISSL